MEKNYQYERIERAISFIRRNYQEQPGLEEIARSVHLTRFHFQRLFTHWAGISPKAFLQYITLEEAKKSLQKGRSTLETSYEVGLSGNSRLHDLFIKIEGCTPGNFRERSRGMILLAGELESPFGSLSVLETDRGISALSFGPREELISRKHYENARFEEGLGLNGRRIQEYFSHWEPPSQAIQLDLAGTPFQIQVWKALLQIPPASLLAYSDIAEKIGNPNSTRAVGRAVGKNPVAYLIPCHRVIRGTGHWGGYHWGSERKMIIHGYEAVKGVERKNR